MHDEVIGGGLGDRNGCSRRETEMRWGERERGKEVGQGRES